MTVGRGFQHQGAHLLGAGADGRRRPDPDVRQVGAGLDLGGHIAAEQALDLLARFGPVDALQFGEHRVDLDLQPVAGDHHPGLHLGDAADLADGVGHLRRGPLQQGDVVGIELHLDGLRHGRQVADQVLHQLGGLDLEAGHVGLHLVPDLGHHLLDRPAAGALQADEIVADVRFAEAAPKLEAGAPRIGVHVGRGADDRLHLPHQPVGLGQRHAGGGDVVEDEAALVDLGNEARADAAEGDDADEGQHGHAGDRQDRPGDRGLQRAPVAAHHAPVGVDLGNLAAGLDQLFDHHRHQPPGDQERDRERHGHGDRQSLEEGAGDAGQEGQRQEDHDGRR